jgi:predicted small secreted protein
MKKNLLAIIAVALFIAVAFTSCETATGQGAGWGAATGAVLWGLTSRHSAEGAAVGALIGANTGAIIGASIDEANADRYGPPPRGGFPFARPTERPGFYVSPYPPHRVYNLRHVPPGGLVEDEMGGGYFRKP